MTPPLHLEHLPEHERHIVALMSRSPLPFNTRLKPEQRLTIRVADELRKLTSEGKYNGVWTHITNEGKRSQIAGAIAKAMGMIPGAPDFVFAGQWGAGFIEMKEGKGKLQDTQIYFRSWVQQHQLGYATCTSVESVLDTLREWGALV